MEIFFSEYSLKMLKKLWTRAIAPTFFYALLLIYYHINYIFNIFTNCYSLTSLELSNFDISSA